MSGPDREEMRPDAEPPNPPPSGDAGAASLAPESPRGQDAPGPAPATPAPGPVPAPAPQPTAAVPASTDAPIASAATDPQPAPRLEARSRPSRLAAALTERPELATEVPSTRLAAQSRRDFLLYFASAVATAAVAWWLLPDRARQRLLPGSGHDRLDALAARLGITHDRGERLLDRALTFDDDVAEALYSRDRRVRTYDRSEARPLRNNYDGQTPGPEYLATWSLELSGLASGRVERLSADQLVRSFKRYDQVTRLVCVEGWSGIAWWGGIRFADFLRAFPPGPGARWAAVRSAVNLDGDGHPDPYYVSIDLDTARHPQTLLATHHEGRPLTVAHGAPLRLVAPMKLGLKNIKAITHISYTADEPPDYWNERGYSRYDGL